MPRPECSGNVGEAARKASHERVGRFLLRPGQLHLRSSIPTMATMAPLTAPQPAPFFATPVRRFVTLSPTSAICMDSRWSSAKTCISARDQPLVLTSLLFWVMDTLQPMSGLCFVKPITTAETLSGGSIVLPESYRARVTAQQAEIVAVGPPGRCDELEDCERPHAGDRHLVDPRIVPGAWVLCAK